MLNASRNFTLDAIDNGVKPVVVNSIMKYHATEKFREVINDSMDILGGAAIIRGEKNLLAHAYFAIPISITVEGANILTRNLMQFGQGLIKCHPYIYGQVQALNANDVKKFDDLLFKHVGLVNSSVFKSLIYYFTRGILISAKGNFKRYRQKLIWISAEFTFLSNISLVFFGANLKKRENIGARFGDILSWCYLITSTLREYDNNPKEHNKVLVDWVCNYGFNQIQIAREELFYNMPFCKMLLPFVKFNPFGIKTEDSLNAKIVSNLNDEKILNELCEGIFISQDSNDTLNKLETAVKLTQETSTVISKVKDAVKQNRITKSSYKNMVEEASQKEIITTKEFEAVSKALDAKQEVIHVDAFDSEVYKAQK